MYWVRVKWLEPLFAAFDRVWPARRHEQDGTIGDAAHMDEVSGHNPDDTPGVRAERQDPDSTPEVRAGDVDARGVDMEAAVQSVLHGPADERDRLIYIIFNRRIWRKANGWREERYTGSDPHDTHAHFSGDPAADEDARPWSAILALAPAPYGEDEEMTELLAEGVDFLPVAIPPVGGTPAVPGPSDVYLNGFTDLFSATAAVALRIYCSDGAGRWTALPGYADGLVVLMSGYTFSAKLVKGTRGLSISRWALDASGRPVDPKADGAVTSTAPVSFAFEKK